MIDLPGTHLAECRHGLMVWPLADQVIGRSLDLYGEFAESENRIIGKYLRPGDVAVDAGANLGTTVLPMAHRVGRSGKVIAFEPQPFIAQCLRATLELNKLEQVRVYSAALSDHAGLAKMRAPDAGTISNFGAVPLGDDGMEVPLMCLDELDLPSCALIKADVEGHEWPLLQGAKNHLLRLSPVLYLEAGGHRVPPAYLGWLLEHGWRCYWHFAYFFQADNFRSNPDNVFGDGGDMNVLAVPAGRAQPQDLPEIGSPQENWLETYPRFFAERGIPLL